MTPVNTPVYLYLSSDDARDNMSYVYRKLTIAVTPCSSTWDEAEAKDTIIRRGDLTYVTSVSGDWREPRLDEVCVGWGTFVRNALTQEYYGILILPNPNSDPTPEPPTLVLMNGSRECIDTPPTFYDPAFHSVPEYMVHAMRGNKN